MTTYYNGWTKEKLWEYVASRVNTMRLVWNTDRGCKYDTENGETYETIITDYTPGSYPYVENIYINGTLAQITRHT